MSNETTINNNPNIKVEHVKYSGDTVIEKCHNNIWLINNKPYKLTSLGGLYINKDGVFKNGTKIAPCLNADVKRL